MHYILKYTIIVLLSYYTPITGMLHRAMPAILVTRNRTTLFPSHILKRYRHNDDRSNNITYILQANRYALSMLQQRQQALGTDPSKFTEEDWARQNLIKQYQLRITSLSKILDELNNKTKK